MMIRKACLPLFLAATLVICGCSEKKVNYELDTETPENAAEEEGTTNSLSAFADAKKWSEDWKVTTEAGNELELHISADISVPDTDIMSVVEVKETEIDAAYKEQLIQKLLQKCFSDAEVYYDDVEHMTKERLAEKITSVQDDISTMEHSIGEMKLASSMGYEELIQELSDEKEELEENLAEYEQALEQAPDDYIIATDYVCDDYLIQQGDVLYKLTFQSDSIVLKMESAASDSIENYRFYQPYEEDTETENECEMTEDEAKAVVQDWIEALGLPNPVLGQVWGLAYYVTEEDAGAVQYNAGTDGYVFNYSTGIDGVSFGQFNMAYENLARLTDSVTDDSCNFISSQIVFEVSDEGVLGFEYDNPIEIVSITKDVELLSLKNIQDIMKNELENNAEKYQLKSGVNSYNAMELIYFRIKSREKEGYYSYVPVWRLSRNYDDVINSPIHVNAIDGSVIYLLEEMEADL